MPNTTYTSQFGSTPQGQGVQNIYNALESVTGIPQSDTAGQGQLQAQSSAMAMQKNAPSYIQNTQKNLTQQAGIPGLQQQYGNLGQIFNLYLQDQNLANKFSSNQNTNPYANQGLMQASQAAQSGMPQVLGASTNNPYLASASQIIGSSTQPAGQGFQGFTTPSLNTGAMSAPVNAAVNMQGLLNNAIGTEQNLVNTDTSDVSQNYQAALNSLLGIANVFGQERQNQAVLGASDQMRNQITQDASQGVTFKDLVNKYRPLGVDANSILQLYQSVGYYKDAKGNPLPLTESPDYLSSIGITGAAAKPNPIPKVITDAQGNKYFQDPSTGQITPWSQKQSPGILQGIESWVSNLFNPPANNSTSSLGTDQIKATLKNEGYTDSQISDYLKVKGLT